MEDNILLLRKLMTLVLHDIPSGSVYCRNMYDIPAGSVHSRNMYTLWSIGSEATG